MYIYIYIYINLIIDKGKEIATPNLLLQVSRYQSPQVAMCKY